MNTKISTLLLAISTVFLLTACGGSSTTTTDTTTAATTTAAATTATTTTPATSTTTTVDSSAGALGKIVWANNCATCHGADYGQGGNQTKVMAAIASNKGGMGILNGKITAADAYNLAVFASNPAAY